MIVKLHSTRERLEMLNHFWEKTTTTRLELDHKIMFVSLHIPKKYIKSD